MDDETAKKVYDCALALDPLLGHLADAVDAIEDEVERRHFRRAVGDLMGAVYSELMHPLERQFPSLIPPKERPTS